MANKAVAAAEARSVVSPLVFPPFFQPAQVVCLVLAQAVLQNWYTSSKGRPATASSTINIFWYTKTENTLLSAFGVDRSACDHNLRMAARAGTSYVGTKLGG
jgi:hypothetical protein